MSYQSCSTDSKILKAKIQQNQLASLKGERKFPERKLQHSSGINLVAEAKVVDLPSNTFFGRFVTAWGVFSVLAILG